MKWVYFGKQCNLGNARFVVSVSHRATHGANAPEATLKSVIPGGCSRPEQPGHRRHEHGTGAQLGVRCPDTLRGTTPVEPEPPRRESWFVGGPGAAAFTPSGRG